MQEVSVKNAADEKQVNQARQKDEDKSHQDHNDLCFILSDQRGRRFIWDLLERCGVYTSSFTGNSVTFFNEGRRDIGLKLLHAVHETPDQYSLMVQENKKKKETQNKKSKGEA